MLAFAFDRRFEFLDKSFYLLLQTAFMSLRLITTGGTFDKHYDPIKGTLGFSKTHVHSILERCRLTVAVAVTELPLIDSLEMQDTDRERILAACSVALEPHIVVIHGTDTMPQTAQMLGAMLGKATRTVVITGAMIPYEVADSDALFNLGHAIGLAQTLPHGVYVAMGAQVFEWNKVRKNRSTGRFEEIA